VLKTNCFACVDVPLLQHLYEVEEWAERYRSRNEGTFPGTGPAIYQGTVYFTDNTYPVMLFQHTYNLFSKQLQGLSTTSNTTLGTASTTYEEVAPMQRVAINQPGKAGFMFWSVVVSPVEGDVVVWDSAAHSVQVRVCLLSCGCRGVKQCMWKVVHRVHLRTRTPTA
jgi:hypothetical protein